MTQTIKKRCDRCGKEEILHKTIEAEVGSDDILEVPIPLKLINLKHRKRLDLCSRCRKVLEIRIDEFIEEGDDHTPLQARIKVPATDGFPVRRGGATGHDRE